MFLQWPSHIYVSHPVVERATARPQQLSPGHLCFVSKAPLRSSCLAVAGKYLSDNTVALVKAALTSRYQVISYSRYAFCIRYTTSYNKVRELIAIKVLHISLLNTTVVAFQVLPLGRYAPMPAPSPPFKTILEMVCGMAFRAAVVVLLMSSMSSRCLPFNISFTFGKRKSQWELYPVNRQGVPT